MQHYVFILIGLLALIVVNRRMRIKILIGGGLSWLLYRKFKSSPIAIASPVASPIAITSPSASVSEGLLTAVYPDSLSS